MGIVVERADSQFGRYVSATWSDPRDPLLPTARIWYFDGTLEYAIERHYPDGTCEMIVQLETPHAPEGAPAGTRFPPVCTSGIASRHFGVVAPRGLCRVVGIVLDPLTFSTAIGMPLDGTSNVTLDLHDVIGPAATELAQRCAAPRAAEAIVAAALQWLRARVARGRGVDERIAHALARLQRSHGTDTIGTIEHEVGIAGPRLARRFTATFGLSPKRFARILRFHHALKLIRDGSYVSLADVAANAGYYDQAHMYGDFAEFCDRTPAGFARARHYPGSISVAEHEPASLLSNTA